MDGSDPKRLLKAANSASQINIIDHKLVQSLISASNGETANLDATKILNELDPEAAKGYDNTFGNCATIWAAYMATPQGRKLAADMARDDSRYTFIAVRDANPHLESTPLEYHLLLRYKDESGNEHYLDATPATRTQNVTTFEHLDGKKQAELGRAIDAIFDYTLYKRADTLLAAIGMSEHQMKIGNNAKIIIGDTVQEGDMPGYGLLGHDFGDGYGETLPIINSVRENTNRVADAAASPKIVAISVEKHSP